MMTYEELKRNGFLEKMESHDFGKHHVRNGNEKKLYNETENEMEDDSNE